MVTEQILRLSHMQFINEILRQTDTRDSMNDYYPNRIWVDTDTGTYGSCEGLVVLDTTEWSSDDDDAWECMTDSERNEYGLEYQRANGQCLNPLEYQRETGSDY